MIYAARQFCFGFFDMEFHLEFDMKLHMESNMENAIRFHATESAERKGIEVNERQ